MIEQGKLTRSLSYQSVWKTTETQGEKQVKAINEHVKPLQELALKNQKLSNKIFDE